MGDAVGYADCPLAAYGVNGGEKGVRRMPQDRTEKSDEEVKGLKEKSGGFSVLLHATYVIRGIPSP